MLGLQIAQHLPLHKHAWWGQQEEARPSLAIAAQGAWAALGYLPMTPLSELRREDTKCVMGAREGGFLVREQSRGGSSVEGR